jgi:hypothetical protein
MQTGRFVAHTAFRAGGLVQLAIKFIDILDNNLKIGFPAAPQQTWVAAKLRERQRPDVRKS